MLLSGRQESFEAAGLYKERRGDLSKPGEHPGDAPSERRGERPGERLGERGLPGSGQIQYVFIHPFPFTSMPPSLRNKDRPLME